jgi:hypothetical protein
MKTGRNRAIAVAVSLIAGLAVSCASTGAFLPAAPEETVIGRVQAQFVTRNVLNGRDAVNMQAYIKLLEAAQSEYGQDGQLDIRDILWASGRDIGYQNTEYTATGKVVIILPAPQMQPRDDPRQDALE